MKQWLKGLISKMNITFVIRQLKRLSYMKECANEKRIAKKADLERMRKRILKEDRKEDNKMYVKKPRKKS
jgi:hypothetical protein